jgi:hypothetical protein
MPWHIVQFFRIMFQTGPSGRSICGRVARFWAATGVAIDATNAAIITTAMSPIAAVPNLSFIENLLTLPSSMPAAKNGLYKSDIAGAPSEEDVPAINCEEPQAN